MSTTGKYLEVRVGSSSGVRLAGVQEWSAEEQGDDLDATDADSGGYEDTDVGVTGLRVTVKGIHNVADDGPFPAIARGTLFTNLRLFGNVDQATPDFTVPLAISTKPARTVRVRGQIEYSVEIRSKGAYAVG